MMMKSLMDEFSESKKLAVEENKWEAAQTFEQFVSYTNLGHQKTPVELLEFLHTQVNKFRSLNVSEEQEEALQEIEVILAMYSEDYTS